MSDELDTSSLAGGIKGDWEWRAYATWDFLIKLFYWPLLQTVQRWNNTYQVQIWRTLATSIRSSIYLRSGGDLSTVWANTFLRVSNCTKPKPLLLSGSLSISHNSPLLSTFSSGFILHELRVNWDSNGTLFMQPQRWRVIAWTLIVPEAGIACSSRTPVMWGLYILGMHRWPTRPTYGTVPSIHALISGHFWPHKETWWTASCIPTASETNSSRPSPYTVMMKRSSLNCSKVLNPSRMTPQR